MRHGARLQNGLMEAPGCFDAHHSGLNMAEDVTAQQCTPQELPAEAPHQPVEGPACLTTAVGSISCQYCKVAGILDLVGSLDVASSLGSFFPLLLRTAEGFGLQTVVGQEQLLDSGIIESDYFVMKPSFYSDGIEGHVKAAAAA